MQPSRRRLAFCAFSLLVFTSIPPSHFGFWSSIRPGCWCQVNKDGSGFWIPKWNVQLTRRSVHDDGAWTEEAVLLVTGRDGEGYYAWPRMPSTCLGARHALGPPLHWTLCVYACMCRFVCLCMCVYVCVMAAHHRATSSGANDWANRFCRWQ